QGDWSRVNSLTSEPWRSFRTAVIESLLRPVSSRDCRRERSLLKRGKEVNLRPCEKTMEKEAAGPGDSDNCQDHQSRSGDQRNRSALQFYARLPREREARPVGFSLFPTMRVKVCGQGKVRPILPPRGVGSIVCPRHGISLDQGSERTWRAEPKQGIG